MNHRLGLTKPHTNGPFFPRRRQCKFSLTDQDKKSKNSTRYSQALFFAPKPLLVVRLTVAYEWVSDQEYSTLCLWMGLRIELAYFF